MLADVKNKLVRRCSVVVLIPLILVIHISWFLVEGVLSAFEEFTDIWNGNHVD
jgi:hypothetical protein